MQYRGERFEIKGRNYINYAIFLLDFLTKYWFSLGEHSPVLVRRTFKKMFGVKKFSVPPRIFNFFRCLEIGENRPTRV